MRSVSPLFLCPLLLSCSGTVDIGIELIDPCNQEAIGSVDFLKFIPLGEGIDSAGLTTIQEISDKATQPIDIPLANDFVLVATGHRGEFNQPPSAIGVSARRDLTTVENELSIRIPFALVDSFYKTTSLDNPQECTTLTKGRYNLTATFIPENSRALVVGGSKLEAETLEYPKSVEAYNPTTGGFEIVAELRSGGARSSHTATRLADGRVLIAGGESHVQFTREALRSAFIIDARDSSNVTVAEGGLAMRQARTGHTAVLLNDGRVLFTGGRVLNAGATQPQDHTYLASIEIYDPENGVFTLPTNPSGNAVEMSDARFGHTATLLTTGTDVLIAGGMNSAGPVLTPEVIRVDGDTVTIVQATEATGVGPIFHAAALAQNGFVMLSGGYGTIADAEPAGGLPQNASRDVEMWEFMPVAGELHKRCAASMNTPRGFHTATMVDKRVVFIGGREANGVPTATAEVATLSLGQCFAAPPQTQTMSDKRAQHAAVLLEDTGEILVVGGRQQEVVDAFGRSIESTEIFSPARDPEKF